MAWRILFQDPEFWGRLRKREFAALRGTCRGFRDEIPERLAILGVLQGHVVHRRDLLRVLPLAVRDVLLLPLRVDFACAFRVAEARAGGFGRCMAMIRERVAMPRVLLKNLVLARLRLHGIDAGGIAREAGYQAAMRRPVGCSVLVWTYVGRTEGPHEYGAAKECLRRAANGHYRRIHRDARAVLGAIRQGVSRMHVVLSGSRLLIGSIRLL